MQPRAPGVSSQPAGGSTPGRPGAWIDVEDEQVRRGSREVQLPLRGLEEERRHEPPLEMVGRAVVLWHRKPRGQDRWVVRHPSAAFRTREVLLADLLGQRREHIVPDCGEAAAQLRDSGGPRDKPPVEMLAPVSPPADVHPADLADRPNRSLDPRQLDSEVRGELAGEVARIRVVLARHEQDDQRQAVRILRGHQAPALVRPDELVVRRVAGPAFHAAGADSRLLLADRREELSWPDVAFEGPGVPLVERRRAQGILRALVQLLGRLRHSLRC